MDENEIYALYREATGEEKDRLEAELIPMLRRYATAITRHKLKEWNLPLSEQDSLVNYAVWLAIHNHKSYEGRNGAKFTTWFHSLVIQTCLMTLRTKARRREVALEDVPEPMHEVADATNRQIELDRLVEDHLSNEERELVRLQLTGADSQEIAKELNTTPVAVRLRLMRLKDKLRIAVTEKP